MHTALVAALVVFGAGNAPAPKSERHAFAIHAHVSYRCYAGTGATKQVDSRTRMVCDSQNYEKTVIHETVTVTIEDVPGPEQSPSLQGGWHRTVEYQGRKFTVSFSLFKDLPSSGDNPYRIRVVARDDEPTTRGTAVFAEAPRILALNPLTLEHSSAGQPEEIRFNASIRPVKQSR